MLLYDKNMYNVISFSWYINMSIIICVSNGKIKIYSFVNWEKIKKNKLMICFQTCNWWSYYSFPTNQQPYMEYGIQEKEKTEFVQTLAFYKPLFGDLSYVI